MLKSICETGRFFEKMFTTHGAVMLLVDPSDGTILSANESAIRFYGFELDKFCKMRIQDINLLSQDEVEKEYIKAAKEERSYFIFPHQLSNGIVKIVEVHSSPIELDGKSILFSIIHDISKRVEAEKKLKLSEERWEFSNESTKDGLWDWDIASNKVYFSPLWKEMFGYEDHELGNSLDEWSKRVHPDDIESVMKELERHLAGETPIYSSEHRMIHKDGSIVWILDRGKVVERDNFGKPLRAVGTHVNITEMKRLYEELERVNQELVKSMQKVSTLEGILPICSSCKRIRDDKNHWNLMEEYIQNRTKAEFSHGICPDCARKLYPEYFGSED